VIDYRAEVGLEAPPEVVWRKIERSEEFEGWWGWLCDFRLEGEGLVAGSVLHGVVNPPVPYRMTLRVELTRCSPPTAIDAIVEGDLRGSARLNMEPDGDGTRASVGWSIEMMQMPMRLAARVARPLLVWGHDKVVEMTVRSLPHEIKCNTYDGGHL
jgi:hypothetical protein